VSFLKNQETSRLVTVQKLLDATSISHSGFFLKWIKWNNRSCVAYCLISSKITFNLFYACDDCRNCSDQLKGCNAHMQLLGNTSLHWCLEIIWFPDINANLITWPASLSKHVGWKKHCTSEISKKPLYVRNLLHSKYQIRAMLIELLKWLISRLISPACSQYMNQNGPSLSTFATPTVWNKILLTHPFHTLFVPP